MNYLILVLFIIASSLLSFAEYIKKPPTQFGPKWRYETYKTARGSDEQRIGYSVDDYRGLSWIYSMGKLTYVAVCEQKPYGKTFFLLPNGSSPKFKVNDKSILFTDSSNLNWKIEKTNNKIESEDCQVIQGEFPPGGPNCKKNPQFPKFDIVSCKKHLVIKDIGNKSSLALVTDPAGKTCEITKTNLLESGVDGFKIKKNYAEALNEKCKNLDLSSLQSNKKPKPTSKPTPTPTPKSINQIKTKLNKSTRYYVPPSNPTNQVPNGGK